MSDFDDAIGDMTAELLLEAGKSFVYRRGSVSTTITLRMSVQKPIAIETGSGNIVEVRPVDFIGLTSTFPYSPPEPGDVIVDGDTLYELSPQVSEKVWRAVSPQMMRVHTKRVSG